MTGAGDRSEALNWHCDDGDITVGIDWVGAGPVLLMLPALSSISTRSEMYPLRERLAPSYTVVTVDWPGFGTQPKPRIDWRPEIYDAFLTHLLTQVVPKPLATIAAGHAAGYLIRCASAHPGVAGRLVLLSPTWRGPLPTMFGQQHAWFRRLARAVDLPIVGAALYRLNVNRPVIGMMARGHVYSDPQWLAGDRLKAKLAVTESRGARHGSARFVCGCLDPFANRAEQGAAVERITDPILNLFATTAPRKSRAEMEALVPMPGIRTDRLTRGKLSAYEEFPDDTAAGIRKFLADPASQ